MTDLLELLTPWPFPAGLERVQRSFSSQPDNQTCGAAAIRHGLLLGGLTVPAATLEATLNIRNHQGTSPALLRVCLQALGLEAHPIHKPTQQSTAEFLDGLRAEFAQGAFLLPCIHSGEHWVCLGGWQHGQAGVIDSFFGQETPAAWPRDPGLGFFSLSPEELDELDWAHFVTLVRPGHWRAQYQDWLQARSTLLRLRLPNPCGAAPLTVADAVRLGVHQYLDDSDYSYQTLTLNLSGGARTQVGTADPGEDALGVQTVGKDDLVVMGRLGGVLSGKAVPPELVIRSSAVCVAHLGEQTGVESRWTESARTPSRVTASA